ncbi:auxin efflux carrier [Apiospora arundinis]|uniref:Auxin efflux carrier n=1 Tax=Apiospora arundinis TaxID=335852 RepID=A0ABR2ITY4_9PEZI
MTTHAFQPETAVMAPTGLSESFLGAIQASLSVLLIIACGAIAAQWNILDANNTKPLSKLCVRIFLPALLITKIGADLEAGSAGRYGIVLVWALACHLLSFLIGLFAHRVLGMPDWTMVAVMFNNSTSYPLLLIGALADTGILETLIGGRGESVSQAVGSTEAYFLVFSTVSNCLTFAVGPRLIDTEHAPEEEKGDVGDGQDDEPNDGEPLPDEESALLHPTEALRSVNPFASSSSSSSSTSFFLSKAANKRRASGGSLCRPPRRRVTLVTRKQWAKLSPRARWWLTLASDFFNAPLLGAILGAVIGLVPALHRAFFNDSNDGGIFTAWLTSPLKKIGGIFVPLPVVIAGVSLYSSLQRKESQGSSSSGRGQGQDQSQVVAKSSNKHPKAAVTVSFILFVRFVLWTGLSIGIVYGLASQTGLLGDDPMLRFAMMLMPVGPPATKLIAMVQVSGAGEGEEASIAKLLTISYLMSPVLSFTVVGGLTASQASL